MNCAWGAHAACGLWLRCSLAGMVLGADHITTLAEDKFYHDRGVWRQFARTSALWSRTVAGAPTVPQRQPAVCRARRVPLPRGPGAPSHGRLRWPRRVAVLGGGDGMAVREILRYPGAWSRSPGGAGPAMTCSRSDNDPAMVRLNGGALRSPKVHIVNADAFQWLHRATTVSMWCGGLFPTPPTFPSANFTTNSFYALLDQRLSASGYAVIQTTSPLVARQSFWTVVATIESVGCGPRPTTPTCPALANGLCDCQPSTLAQPLSPNCRQACAF